MIFPRYHQLDCVRKLDGRRRASRAPGRTTWSSTRRAAARATPSPGWPTGWPACTTTQDEKVFDSVIVITDRLVLDQQLQDTIYQFEHKQGVVQKIDENSTQLAEALEAGAPIVITTLQKFPFVTEKIGELPKRRYAVIVDEAHSSQSGESGDGAEGRAGRRSHRGRGRERRPRRRACRTTRRRSSRRWPARGKQPNLSFFAFTATPKYKTLEVFGQPGPDGKPAAVPPLQHAPGHRGGLHPRRAAELHHLQDLLPADQVHRGRPRGRQDARRPRRSPAS